MENALKDLAAHTNNSAYRTSNSLRPSQGYIPIQFSKENFHEIKQQSSNNKISFIDGGNTAIFKSPSICIHFIRISNLIYQNNKRVQSETYEFFLLVKAEYNQELKYKTKAFFLNDKDINELHDLKFHEKDFPDGIETVPSFIRRIAELKIAENSICNLESGDLIILDGTLKAQTKEELQFLNSLLTTSKNKNITTIGIAKTTNLLTDTGDSALPVISKLSPYQIWYYKFLYDSTPENHPAQIFISKLHINSNYSFRVEVDKNQTSNLDIIFSILASNSTDPVFLGYPYGLVEADRMARVSNSEKEYLKTIFRSKVKLQEYEAQQDAHNILDNIS